MGLDMYAYSSRSLPNKPVDFEIGEDSHELAYWRKHPNLHGWMEQLYRQKGGARDVFNTTTVQLNEYDIDRLETAVLHGTLPYTSGFFFGTSTDDDQERDLQFIKAARAALNDGLAVFYWSWW